MKISPEGEMAMLSGASNWTGLNRTTVSGDGSDGTSGLCAQTAGVRARARLRELRASRERFGFTRPPSGEKKSLDCPS
jgi:hypothetical protein